MRVSRVQAAENRERVLDAATRLFRERGFDGISVADVMQGAGLTHGGFYGQFGSKEDLAAEACTRAFAKTHERWTRKIDAEGAAGFAAIVRNYLSPQHRDHPGAGCTLAALGADASRRERAVQGAFAASLAATVDLVSRVMPGRLKAARRRRALATMASLVGALVLARAVDDRTLSDEILAATAAALGE
jgi:TetR/AcrR family transcriptional repressor of nem operon